MQINQFRLLQSQNKPAFAGKAFIKTSDPPAMAKEVEDILKTETNTSEHKFVFPTGTGLAIFAPDAHIATVITELTQKGRLTTRYLSESVDALISAGEKVAKFDEKPKKPKISLPDIW